MKPRLLRLFPKKTGRCQTASVASAGRSPMKAGATPLPAFSHITHREDDRKAIVVFSGIILAKNIIFVKPTLTLPTIGTKSPRKSSKRCARFPTTERSRASRSLRCRNGCGSRNGIVGQPPPKRAPRRIVCAGLSFFSPFPP